jgi:hypothetical protein
MTTKDPGFFPPPVRVRQPAFWMALLSLSFLIGGLVFTALPDSISGPVAWRLSAQHGLRQADVIGLALLATGIGLTWLAGWIWQWTLKPSPTALSTTALSTTALSTTALETGVYPR